VVYGDGASANWHLAGEHRAVAGSQKKCPVCIHGDVPGLNGSCVGCVLQRRPDNIENLTKK